MRVSTVLAAFAALAQPAPCGGPRMKNAPVVRPRLIPVLLLKHGLIVRSQLFKVHQVIGNR